MKSRMLPRHYLSQEVFDREQERIFRKLWVFAGLCTMLRQHNDFITREIAGIPIFIQNIHGELKAFENICLHRSARLQSQRAGRRPVVCSYHGWSYDVNGVPSKIPLHDEIYRFTKKERCAMRLRQFALQIVGNLIFVNVDASPMPFEDQFSELFIGQLKDSSSAYDSEVITTTWHGRFNWKLAYENLRDSNHVGFVHPTTLAKIVSFENLVDEDLHVEAVSKTSTASDTAANRAYLRRLSYGGAEGAFKTDRRYRWHSMVERWGNQDAYFNWLAYPNLHIASSDGGYSFTIENHVPVAPGMTHLEIYWMTAKKYQRFAYSSQVLLSQMHGSKTVVGEDVQAMEQVQSAFHEGAPVGHQGDYEGLNKLVERWYVEVIDGDRAI